MNRLVYWIKKKDIGIEMDSRYAPIVVFAYKRKDKLQCCLQALEKNSLAKESDLIVYSDGYKGADDKEQVEEVRDFLKLYDNNGFKTISVIESPQNKGLAGSIIGGVTEVLDKYGKVIVVEDDIVTAPDFLKYMNKALAFYEEFPEYGSISAYTYPLKELKQYTHDVYVTHKGDCWGWGTWKDRWEKVDWQVKSFNEYLRDKTLRMKFNALEYGLDEMLIQQMYGKINSWAVRWCYHLFINQKLTVYPRESRVLNIGVDGTGEHCTATSKFNGELKNSEEDIVFEKLLADRRLESAAARYGQGLLRGKILGTIKILISARGQCI